MKGSSKFAFDISWVFVSQIVALGSGFLLNIILSRWLGPADFGLYTLTLTLFTVSTLVAGIGIPETIVKYVADYKDDQERLNTIVTTGVINSILLGTVASLVFFLFSGEIAEIFGMPDLAGLIRIIAPAISLSVVNTTLLSLLNGLREMRSYSFRFILRSFLLIVLATLFILSGFGAAGAVLALLLTEIGTFAFVISVARRHFSLQVVDHWATTKKILTFGSQVFIAGAIFLINTYTDTLLIGYMLTDADVGWYAVAFAIARVAFLSLPGSISTVSYPAISEYYSKGLRDAVEAVITRSIRYCLILLSTVGLVLICLSEAIITFVFGPAYLPAVPVIIILVYGMIVFGAVSSIGPAISAMNRPGLSSKATLVMAGANVCFDVTLIPLLGITGAAIGTVGSYTILAVLILWVLHHVFDIRIESATIITTFGVITVLIIAFFLLRDMIHPYVLAVLFTGLYGVYIYRILLTPDDKREFFSMVSPIFVRIAAGRLNRR
ncbi:MULTISPECIES: flippase [unclassified Methanoculleus]|uniref:flippase n=1 Tax=unclassified Methanoculleus TaxID=2619537 RepID=UPI0025F97AD4|nr:MULTISPECIES: flippase [unclassified Methanoculleus]MCK9297347.1 flippase [Methanoculleus sp.]MDD2254036.1 flippase [Methanoculleus sp.]MDD2786594.1 flippase [Methanoculleus sp.]MDD3216459.1 flippase [Methanoculleus sp.]MDD4313345.1 flippase [Methanoculleus sp.]